ncbi:50S ribosomal protein L11 methyltransferase [Alphaproteobacteria bacterium]|nr:50S ribosomal protein L11 methyltransferase [Alphaproteobacteria bacterium]
MDLWSVSFLIEEKYKNLFSEYVESFDGYISSSLFANEQKSKKCFSGFSFDITTNKKLGEFYQSQFWTLEILLDQKPLNRIITTKLNNLAKQFKINQYRVMNDFSKNEQAAKIVKINKITSKNWLKLNRKSFPTIHVDNFFIYGSHIINGCPVNKIPIKIDASIAFGTGSHSTTKSCLKAITYLSRFFRPKQILDYGCGTGILGIASKKIFKNSEITFVDIDINAKKLTKENIACNNIKSNKIYLTNTYNFSKYKKKKLYDLALANILFSPLYNLASTFKYILKPGSIIILSGLLKTQAPHIINRYSKFGFKQKKLIIMDDWATIIMTLK